MCGIEQKGRSFIEMMGVMLVIGLITIAAFQGYNRANMQNKINKTFDQVAMLITKARTVFVKQGNYNGLNTQTANMLGIVEDEMKGENSVINGVFGPIEINAQKGTYRENEDAHSAICIKLINIPKKVCQIIVARYWSVTISKGFLGIGVNEDTTDCLSDWSSNSNNVICTYGATDQAVLKRNISTLTDVCAEINDVYLKFQ